MRHNVKVPWETRLSKAAEHAIAARLSLFSTANKYDVDVGIDYHCELIEKDTPTFTFFVQAKGTEHFDDNWGAKIKKSTLLYWLLRPTPVFLIVYDVNNHICYWMSIESHRYGLFKKLSESTSETVYLKMDKSHILENGKGKNAEFISKIKQDLISVEQFRGHPLFKGEGYVRLVPDPPRSKFELRETKETIRAGLYSLLIHYLFVKRDLENAYLLGEFLTRFDKAHYNHFVWFGQINKALGNNNVAKRNLEKALEICKSDPNWPKSSIKDIIAQIEDDIESLK